MSSSIRKSLLTSFRVSLVVNVLVFVGFVVSVYCQRSKVAALESSVEKLVFDNARLSLLVDHSVFHMTNTFSRVAASVVSNTLSRSSLASPSSLKKSFSGLPKDVPDVRLPPFDFWGYCEIDGVAFIRLGDKMFKKGDILLGFPIEEISPDVVQYRDNFFKVVKK